MSTDERICLRTADILAPVLGLSLPANYRPPSFRAWFEGVCLRLLQKRQKVAHVTVWLGLAWRGLASQGRQAGRQAGSRHTHRQADRQHADAQARRQADRQTGRL